MVMVSINCITYNHEKYIAQAIEGFLSQRTNFEVEILIHDDASTDRTADIIREYVQKYPEKFNVIYQTENHYSKGVFIGRLNEERARG
ncbi:MAG: glycosyltransferase, partial [Exiguobacterium sp.]|nr:glycosyltransferase [Exiguobacterium sp.]